MNPTRAKNTARDAVMASGIDPAKALDSFFELEIEPLQSVSVELNGTLGREPPFLA